MRLSWLFEKFAAKMEMPADFRELLRALAPRKLAALEDQSQWGCYRELVAHLGTLFPVNDFSLDWAEELREEGSAWWSWGIPVGWQGCDYYYNGSDTGPLAIELIVRLHEGGSIDPKTVSKELAPHLDRMMPLLMQPLAKFHRPPRGRVFRQPWNGLKDMWDWATQNTGYGLLDVSAYEADESGDEGPPWNLEEIRHCARMWRECEPIMNRAWALVRHIHEAPLERLPQLAGALVGDPATLKQITKPR